MKTFKLIIMASMLASASYAGPVVEKCNTTVEYSRSQQYFPTFANYRSQIPFSGAMVSRTLPTPNAGDIHIIKFDPSTDYTVCVDGAAPNNWCGTPPLQSSLVSDSAWVGKIQAIRLVNTSGTIPTVLNASSTTPTKPLKYTVCKE